MMAWGLSQDKTESLFHRELQNQHAELERLNAELRAENSTMARQMKARRPRPHPPRQPPQDLTCHASWLVLATEQG